MVAGNQLDPAIDWSWRLPGKKSALLPGLASGASPDYLHFRVCSVCSSAPEASRQNLTTTGNRYEVWGEMAIVRVWSIKSIGDLLINFKGETHSKSRIPAIMAGTYTQCAEVTCQLGRT